ncbi:MAG: helix-turn-helix domain-containing protein [Candidatus Bathyarchaeia archaeon]
MIDKKYSIEVNSEAKIIEVKFASSINFDMVEETLNQLKNYIAENYSIKLIGYINKDYNYIKAFMLALSLFGNEKRIIFENKAKFRKAERKLLKKQMQELRREGYKAKQISEKLGVPLKTIYRWFNEETIKP